jgi:hypothetical protein
MFEKFRLHPASETPRGGNIRRERYESRRTPVDASKIWWPPLLVSKDSGVNEPRLETNSASHPAKINWVHVLPK